MPSLRTRDPDRRSLMLPLRRCLLNNEFLKRRSGSNDYVPKEEYYSLDMRRIIKLFLLSILLGLVGLAASSTLEPWGVYQGFPFAISYPNPITCMPNPFNGCGFYYDPVMIVLDYIFWLGTAVVGLSAISMFWNRLVMRGGVSHPTSD